MKWIAQTILVLFIVVNIASVPVSATTVNRLAICNNEGYAGDVIDIPITLAGVSEERIGGWNVFYKKTEGDGENADITSWIELIPANYTLVAGEEKEFTVQIAIPRNAKPGLYGAISEEADMDGHSGERRTYIIFEDAASSAAGAGGSAVYSGLLIPVSVNVLADHRTPKKIEEKIVFVVLAAIVVVSLVLLQRRRKK